MGGSFLVGSVAFALLVVAAPADLFALCAPALAPATLSLVALLGRQGRGAGVRR